MLLAAVTLLVLAHKWSLKEERERERINPLKQKAGQFSQWLLYSVIRGKNKAVDGGSSLHSIFDVGGKQGENSIHWLLASATHLIACALFPYLKYLQYLPYWIHYNWYKLRPLPFFRSRHCHWFIHLPRLSSLSSLPIYIDDLLTRTYWFATLLPLYFSLFITPSL